MLKKNSLFIAFALTTLIGMPALAQNTALHELQEIDSVKIAVADSNKSFDRNHWAFKTLEDTTKKYGLLVGKPNEKFDGSKSITRNEAAILLINLAGKIEQDRLELTESEKTKIEILKQELQDEVKQLTEKVASLETNVSSLKGSVTKLEEADQKNFKFDYGDKFKINGAMQAQFTGNFKKGDDQYPSNFLLPYSEIKLTGKLSQHFDYKTLLIPTHLFDDTSIKNGLLDDAYVSTNIIPHHTVYFGQTRSPIGCEGQQSPLDIDIIDKAQIARNFSDTLDIGIKTKGSWDYFEYQVGAYNGSGINHKDNNNGLDLASWAVFKPLYKYQQLGNLELGGGYAVGQNTNISHNTTSFYGGYKLGKYALKSEYAFTDGYLASNQKSRGWYVHNTYYLTPKLQLVGRYDRFDPNTKTTRNSNTEYTLGSNYYLANNLSLMTGYVYVQNKVAKNSHRLEVLTQVMF